MNTAASGSALVEELVGQTEFSLDVLPPSIANLLWQRPQGIKVGTPIYERQG